ncbi:uncharacterized protein LOC121379371 isoform X2 [Gigantopelta aegis]|uniref:uncharacterized protein LOC121379371 isoform X2 n=1 Tax=Gigantopelta aegis TaxID=1735272 RepID=UPI001B888E52|nr:uncharacterized protein LOC121379371 isoform X2 [Gigantopelta aegis]
MFRKLRPVLDHRMPTLSSRTAFMLPLGNTAIPRKRSRLRELELSSPRCLKEVHIKVKAELKATLKKLLRIERAYYGEQKTIHQEVERYVIPVKSVMKGVLHFECNSSASVEGVIKMAHNPTRYKGKQEHVDLLKEVYAKLQNFMPDKLTDVVNTCHKLVELVTKYCVSFYDADSENEGYLETASHYQEQITSWQREIDACMHSVDTLYRKFKSKGIRTSHLSQTVVNFVNNYNLDKVLFLVLFPDACTNLKNVLALLTSWIQTDENYPTFIRNDITDLEASKEDKIKQLREAKQKCHLLIFRTNQLQVDYRKLETEVNNLYEKYKALRSAEESFSQQLNDMELEIEFKEHRRDGLKKEEINAELTTENYEMLTADLKNLKDRLPFVQRHLANLRFKLNWIEEKIHRLKKIAKDIDALGKELEDAETLKKPLEGEYSEIEMSLTIARRIVLLKTSNDTVEKLYYSMPVDTKFVKNKGSAQDTLPFDRVCRVITNSIDKDWANMYRNLPFHPKRGSVTIERDIRDITNGDAHANCVARAKQAFARWRRYHTRCRMEDLRETLRKIKRFDILRAVHLELNPPVITIEEEEVDEQTPPVPPELLPFYELGERYDKLHALGRV